MNQTKLLSSNPDRLDLLMVSEQFSEVLFSHKLSMTNNALMAVSQLSSKTSALSAQTLFLHGQFYVIALILLITTCSRNKAYIYVTSFAFF